MTVITDNGYELMIQDYHAFEPGKEVGLLVKPEDIQVMQKERLCNHLTINGKEYDIPFDKVSLQDNEEDGMMQGEVYFILYKGDHYHLQVRTDDGEDIYVDTNDIWDDGDRVGINFNV